MPELPEVEILARDLHSQLTSAAFTQVEILWPRSVATPDPTTFCRQLCGKAVLAVGRRGKFIVVSLSGPSFLLIHLRMSGQLRMVDRADAIDPHCRAVFHLADGRRLDFSDTRKFGRLYWLEDATKVLAMLGPEPLDKGFAVEELASLLSRRKGALKPLLLDQRVLAGLGNIYTDEVLFEAGLHPMRRVNTLTGQEITHLYQSIQHVLQQAIVNRGTTLGDARFRDTMGRAGQNGEYLQVYQRSGRPCVRCGTPIQREVIGGRGSHFCPQCQPLAGG